MFAPRIHDKNSFAYNDLCVHLTELDGGENERERIRTFVYVCARKRMQATTSTWKRVDRFLISKGKQDAHTNETNKMKKRKQ